MDNLFFTLLEALVATIKLNANIVTKGALVELGRIRPYDESELPAVGVFYVGDTTLGEFGPQNPNFMDWDLLVAIEIAVDADANTTPAGFQQDLLNLRADVHAALMEVAPTQGLSFVSITAPRGGDEPTIDDAGRVKTASYRTNWLFRVRTEIDDMTT
jgi:hypothetical protein